MKQTILVITALLVAFCGCHREPTIEDQPVKEIKISQPGAAETPVEKAVVKRNSMLGPDKVYKVDAKRYYNTVIPIGAVEISVGEADTRFYVPDMKASDVLAFLTKYFPYQKLSKGDNRFVVEGKLLEQYEDDSIIPQLDPNIIQPSASSVIEITVFWSPSKENYEWKYADPMERVRAAERDVDIKEKIEKREAILNPAQKVVQSNDSPGLMVGSGISEIR